ncbi:hypothetical protein HPB48_007405 [Haemaphysalis longicornis]|uniref:Ionotropic receptor n=1 Tax=Haemaphysalis longicornis TaxID=44386 RepID=A0A9J6G412_HAELO|nr:hypothetical protein HPB48_007405 [Haemaphysalis longicornis]
MNVIPVLLILATSCKVFTTGALFHSLAMDVMTSLDNEFLVTIAAPGNTSTSIGAAMPFLDRAVWIWTNYSLHLSFPLAVWLKKGLHQPNLVIFLPWHVNPELAYVRILLEYVLDSVETYFLFSVRGNETLSLHHLRAHLDCQVLYVSPSFIREPTDSFNSCAPGRLSTRLPLAVFERPEGDEKMFPRNLQLVAATKFGATFQQNIRRFPEAMAVIKAYAALNTTLSLYDPTKEGNAAFPVSERMAHFGLFPTPLTVLPNNLYFSHALYPPCRLCFFTRRVVGITIPLSLSLFSFLVFATYLLVIIFVAAILCPCCGQPCKNQPAEMSVVTLYLLAASLGRSPEPLHFNDTGRKFLIGTWLLGTFFAGAYLQSCITAETYVPEFSNEVQDIADLEKRIDAGSIMPCIDYDTYWILRDSGTALSKKLLTIINQNIKDSVDNKALDKCFRLAVGGSHIYIRPCGRYDSFLALQWGLVKGEDTFQMYLRESEMLKNCPVRHQHRRVLLAVSESGMDIHEGEKCWT